MSAENHVTEVVGAFASRNSFQAAIDEVLASGSDHADLSLLATEDAVEQKLGRRYTDVSELADDPTVPRASYVANESMGDAEGGLVSGFVYVTALAAAGVVIASGGTLAPAIAAAAVAGGAGGFFGAVLARLVGARHAGVINEHLKHGGLLLWVRVWDPERGNRVAEILSKNGGRDVHSHRFVPRRSPAVAAGRKRLLIALFSTKGEAENAQHRLVTEGVPASDISLRVIKEVGAVPASMDPELWSFSLDPFFWFLGDLKEDYAQYIRNGETALSVQVDSDDQAEAVASILDLFKPVRVDAIKPDEQRRHHPTQPPD